MRIAKVEAAKEHQNKYCGYHDTFTNDVKDPGLTFVSIMTRMPWRSASTT
jgi:hypothetical protein